ncbi:MAG: NAD-dependent protein deacylase [Rhodocyclaceae bacterium]|nr:NAD-dependent protein deacylase [Rhodocyclaceae bacterium]
MKISAELLARLDGARHVMFFTGAGVSAESGIPTFRDTPGGLWARFEAAELATAEAFRRDPALVWGWYEWRRMKVLRARPNPAHEAIAALAADRPVSVVTQNVDDLHERSGSDVRAHLHGHLDRPRCFDCGTPARHPPGVPAVAEGGARIEPPACRKCGGLLRPGVVWFGEALPAADWQAAMQALDEADLLFSVGTSSLVWPAAEIPLWAARRGACVVQVNPQPTALDEVADFNLQGPAGEVLRELLAARRRPSER